MARRSGVRTIEHDIFNMPIRKKTKAESRQKGANNERECAKTVGYWTGTEFARTPASGGLHWKTARGVAADLVCTDPDFYFPFSVETKHLHRFEAPLVVKVWNQVLRDAIRCAKLPLALLRKDRLFSFRPDKSEGSFVAYKDYYMFMDADWGGMLVALKVKPVYEFYGPNDQTILGFLFSKVIEAVPYQTLVRMIQNGKYLEKFQEQHKLDDIEVVEKHFKGPQLYKLKKQIRDKTDPRHSTEDSTDSEEE